jgi:uncharacterized protein YukE
MTNNAGSRGVSLRLATLAAIAAAALALAVSGGHSALAGRSHDHASIAAQGLNARQQALHDRMRKLWEDHITWTRLAIVSFAANLPDFNPTAARLLRNQTDIGNTIKPYYGATAGNRLTALLKEHINGAVAILKAAKSGDMAAFDRTKAAWYRNANQIARFLSSADPRNWRFDVVDRLMRTHLDQTLKEAADRLAGDFSADIRDYDAIHRHILVMADALSNGIIAQFPGRFR